MVKDSTVGVLLLAVSGSGILAYGWLLFLSNWWLLTLQLTAFIFTGVILGVLAWIGYTLVTVPPPAHLQEPSDGEEEEDEG